jgi:hypothetical protein
MIMIFIGRLILLGTGPRGGEDMTFTELSPEEQNQRPVSRDASSIAQTDCPALCRRGGDAQFPCIASAAHHATIFRRATLN